jgi:hypothetical protein
MFNCHQEDITTWLKKRPKSRFSEFNAFGAWAYRNYYRHFAWKHPSEVDVFVRQFWSWGGIDGDVKAEINKFLSE